LYVSSKCLHGCYTSTLELFVQPVSLYFYTLLDEWHKLRKCDPPSPHFSLPKIESVEVDRMRVAGHTRRVGQRWLHSGTVGNGHLRKVRRNEEGALSH